MSAWKTLQSFQAELDQCVRCGACQAQCPAYLETGDESAVARGKVVLATALRTGTLSAKDPTLRQAAELCLLCGSCERACPNQVPGDALIAALRQEIIQAQGLSTVGKRVASLIRSKSLLSTLTKGAGLLSPLLFKKLPASSGLQLRFPIEGLQDRSLPPISSRNLFNRLPEFLRGEADKPVLAFFAGCAITYLYPQTGVSIVRLLHRLGYSVWLPKNQGCCGMPALSSGNASLLEQLAASNLQSFAGRDVDYILNACASCNHMLVSHYAQLGGLQLPAPLLDIHVFLEREGLAEQLLTLPRSAEPTILTYHDPCHLRNQGITQAPRRLLQALPQVHYVEMDGAGLCCGLGGTFAATRPDLSRAIGRRKVAGLATSGASLVASACPGCILQLQDIVDQAGLPMRTVHSMELIAAAVEQLAPAKGSAST